jgi:glycosyltransferase involved in cell wall biosynthesis
MTGTRHVIVMVTTSYPRFPGDGIGSFIEPIAKGVAARGHEVHVVAPWHPAIRRNRSEDGVWFHFYRYAPLRALNVFGYAEGLQADTALKAAAWSAAPLALAAGWFKALRVAAKKQATVMHAHWVIPNGPIAMAAAGRRPLVVSLHGSDVFVAEKYPAIGRVARAVFRRSGWVTACSADLASRAVHLGADARRIEVVPYGVDADRFRPSPADRARVREELGIGETPLVFSAGRLVAKKGFEVLIDAARIVAGSTPSLTVVIAGDGDLRDELARRAAALPGVVRLIGARGQNEIAALAAAADVIAVPSVRDTAGNVDGLPNFALEALASGTPVVATRAGGLGAAIADGHTGVLVAEGEPEALARGLASLLGDHARATAIGEAGRQSVIDGFGWPRVAERLERAYNVAAGSMLVSS